MKNILYIILPILFLGSQNSYAKINYDFKAKNKDGAELAYKLLSDGVSVAFTYDTDGYPTYQIRNYSNLQVDTLQIPETVTYNGKQYIVTSLTDYACSLFDTRIKCIFIPKTITHIQYGENNFALTFINSGVQSITVDKDNPYFCSISGILYTKDLKTLIGYPSERREDTISIEEGVEELPILSLANEYVKYVELPLSLRKIDPFALASPEIEKVILKDSVFELQQYCIYTPKLKYLTLGTGLKTIHSNFVRTESILTIYCYSTTPPKVGLSNGNFLDQKILTDGGIYVPRKSMNLYRQADGWSQFKNIYPIEPPIVTGVDNAEVSWVQNFSATGYVWTLYLDEAQTQPYLQLTFDKDGHLTNIDLNRPNAPQLPAEEGDKQEDKRYAEYYSFTITGLDANTKYYYTRQTLAGERVIDEETGLFETLPDGAPTGVNPLLFEPSPQKTFENGMLRIRKNGNTYNVNGTKVE